MFNPTIFTNFTSFGGGKLELSSSSVSADESELCTASGEDAALKGVEAVADFHMNTTYRGGSRTLSWGEGGGVIY